jgi:multidrug efflux pump subunit AcrA (membrane-fusion protein)
MRRFGLLVPAVLLAALFSCRAREEPPPSAQKSAEPSSVVRLSPEAVRTAGIETAAVGDSAGGGVLALTGTLAAKPWTPEEQAALSDAASADAKLRLADANFQRLSRLSRDGVVARQDLDASRAERDQARAAAAQTDAKRANLGLTETALALERKATIWGLASLPEVDLAQVKPSERVEVSTAAFPNQHFSGRVVGVSRSADAETRSFTVRIAIDDPAGLLHPQMLATFAISTPGRRGLAIPKSAVLLEGDGSYVYVQEGQGTFRRQRIETEESSSATVTVTSGLSAGQRVVVRGAQLLESERLKSRIVPAERD